MQLGVILLVVVVLASPLAVEAQPHTKIWRIGYLSIAQIDSDRSWVDAFRDRLRELGYTEGQNLVIEQRHAAQRPDRLSDLAAELARLRVDAIVAYGTLAIEAARRATSEVPIVFTVAAEFAEVGGLMAYGANIPALYRRAGALVDKILEGAKPGDLPVEQPKNFDLAINIKAANALGLTIPQSLLLRANRIIE
jgi:ABC-type uncharacterized transport system substrate-binding protein